MAVYESIQRLLQFQEGKPPLYELPLDKAREQFDTGSVLMAGEGEAVSRVEDHTMYVEKGNVPIRCYYPASAKGDEKLPAFVFYHGGGFVLGNIETHDSFCRIISNRAKCVVISVDYRLAPEHKFPVPTDDCYAALRWVHDHSEELGIAINRIAVGGDSAGGNLAAVTAIRAAEMGGPSIAFQLLIYPAVDSSATYPSYRENGEGYFLTSKEMKWFHEQYVEETTDKLHPYLSPIHSSYLGQLPPAHIVTAQYDPLRDEGEAYATRIQEAGGKATIKRYDRMIHGFVSMTKAIPEAFDAVEEMAEELRKALYAESIVK